MCLYTMQCLPERACVCFLISSLGHMHVFLWQVCEPRAGKYVARVPGLRVHVLGCRFVHAYVCSPCLLLHVCKHVAS